MFDFLGSLMRMVPGYINGYRMAIQDNWNDLNQYNKVQAGQYQNAFTGATFDDNVDMVHANRYMTDLAAKQGHRMDQLATLSQPYNMLAAVARGWFAPETLAYTYGAEARKARSIYGYDWGGALDSGRMLPAAMGGGLTFNPDPEYYQRQMGGM